MSLQQLQSLDKAIPRPVITQQINQMLMEQRFVPGRIIELIEQNKRLSTRLAILAESRLYGTNKHYDSPMQLISELGILTVKHMVTVLELIDLFNMGKIPGFSSKIFWKNAFTCGKISEILSLPIDEGFGEDFFFTGVIKDMGICMEMSNFPDLFIQVFELVEQKRCSFRRAEREIFGDDHATLGMIAARKWNFSESIAEAIRIHHGTDVPTFNSRGKEIAGVVHFVDSYLINLGKDVWDKYEHTAHLQTPPWLDRSKINSIYQSTLEPVSELIEKLFK